MTPIETQTALNAAGFVIAVLGGWWLNNLDRRFRDSERELARHEEKIQSIELLVAGNYITRVEHEKFIAAIFKKLDTIADSVVTVQTSMIEEISDIKVRCASEHGAGK